MLFRNIPRPAIPQAKAQSTYLLSRLRRQASQAARQLPRPLVMAAVATTSLVSASFSTSAKPANADYLLYSYVKQIPHPKKASKGGEDSYFISTDGRSVGVFDGVGGWADSGVDPREFAVKLGEGCFKATEEAKLGDPVAIMKWGFDFAKKVLGSSTACVVSVENSKLKGANLGDSGYFIFRKDKLIFRSEEQQHRFNMPYQLTGGMKSEDTPDSADVLTHDVLPGDLVVLGTDGLFDNLFDEQMASIVAEEVAGKDKSGELIERVANALAKKAFVTSEDKYANTPFAAHAVAAWGRGSYIGGKSDDITVLVSEIKSSEDWKKLRGTNPPKQTTSANEPVPKQEKKPKADGSKGNFMGKAFKYMSAKL